MGTDQFTFEANVLPVVQGWASKRFAGDPDRETKVNDATSVAWEIFKTANDDATPSTIARYAVKRVKANRVHRESIRSVSHPIRRDGTGQTIEAALVARDNANPAKVVGFRLDFTEWFEALKPKSQKVVELLAAGNTTLETADAIGCTPGNVSQYRARLKSSWYSR